MRRVPLERRRGPGPPTTPTSPTGPTTPTATTTPPCSKGGRHRPPRHGRAEADMVAPEAPWRPVRALEHQGIIAWRGVDAVTLLTVYLVLLMAVPSAIRITALGELGRPSLVWGVVLFGWWVISRLQAQALDVAPVSQPIRFAFVALLVIALVSFAAAMLRGQPADQISPATTAVIRLLSWAGVLFTAMDGIRTMNDLKRMLRRIGIAAGLLAGLGVAQAVSGQSFIDFFGSIPGLSGIEGGDGSVAERGGFARSSGTALHPLEYATALNAALPFVIAAGISHGFRFERGKGSVIWWVPVALIAISALLGVSRSAIIGLAVASLLMIPAFPRRARGWVIGGGATLVVAVIVAVPGLFSLTSSLFVGAANDPSTQSRTGGLERAPEFVAASPFYGAGFGTFLPRYYIFDNQWVLIAVELGILGVLAFAAVIFTAIWSAMVARRQSGQADVRLIGHALAASVFTVALLFAFFDGLAFPMAGGLLFLIIGLCGSVRTIGAADAALGSALVPAANRRLS
ncbi:hypothetical protein DCE93_12075 [Agromyces badenianii]|uniref:O-antigen ligase-related domain-containing protein n=2 Tax=Agromyces badenianii TaxID=2080742 RepID=A0A2S0WY66_9MICO|nr:hypothetical protein DCE93_12075 [Agromyces badenianii]